jgi:hypothetical protein
VLAIPLNNGHRRAASHERSERLDTGTHFFGDHQAGLGLRIAAAAGSFIIRSLTTSPASKASIIDEYHALNIFGSPMQTVVRRGNAQEIGLVGATEKRGAESL